MSQDRRRSVEDRAADREVARALRAHEGAVTVADVVVASALPEMVVERSLQRLLDGYDGTVGVAKGGALMYRFHLGPFGLRPRRERRVLLRAAVHAAAAVTSALVTSVRAGFRAVLAIQLLLYLMLLLAPVSVVIGAVVGVGVFIVLIIAAISDGSGGDLIGLLLDPYVAAAVLGGCVLYGIYRVFKAKADWLMALAGRDERGKPGVAGFIAQVADFALGPERPPSRSDRVDRAWAVSQDDERIVLRRVRGKSGRLRAGDLVAWLGLDLDQADRQATRICVEYGGEPAVVPDVEIVEFELRSLLATTGGAEAGQAKTSHERGVELPRLTANSAGEDAAIAGFALVNGAAGAAGWFLLSDRAASAAAHAGWWHAAAVAGGALPLGFAGLIFGLLLLRVPVHLIRSAVRRRRRLRGALHDAMVLHCRRHKEKPIDLDALARERGTTPARVRAVALALGGGFDLDVADDPGKTVWRFRRLARELSRESPGPRSPPVSIQEEP